MRKSLKEWVSTANGWQRIWLVVSSITFIYFLLLFPFIEGGKGNDFRYSQKRAIETEMVKKECLRFLTAPFEQLEEPEYDIDGKVGCYHIYSHRKYYDDHKPFTAQEYESWFEYEYWTRFFSFLGIGFLFAFLLCATAYGVGYVIAWIRKGFKKEQ